MKVVDLYPKQKRVVGWNLFTGKRTAHSLRKEMRWEDMMSDILGCETHPQLLKCSLYWSMVIDHEKWPDDWETAAQNEFELAFKAVEALAAQQAE